jgi:hypothetical protein
MFNVTAIEHGIVGHSRIVPNFGIYPILELHYRNGNNEEVTIYTEVPNITSVVSVSMVEYQNAKMHHPVPSHPS